jgi:hypothetical protein
VEIPFLLSIVGGARQEHLNRAAQTAMSLTMIPQEAGPESEVWRLYSLHYDHDLQVPKLVRQYVVGRPGHEGISVAEAQSLGIKNIKLGNRVDLFHASLSLHQLLVAMSSASDPVGRAAGYHRVSRDELVANLKRLGLDVINRTIGKSAWLVPATEDAVDAVTVVSEAPASQNQLHVDEARRLGLNAPAGNLVIFAKHQGALELWQMLPHFRPWAIHGDDAALTKLRAR